MNIKEFLKDKENIYTCSEAAVMRKRIVCSDGAEFSVQASSFHYCFPRESRFDGEYSNVEVLYYTKEPEFDVFRAHDFDGGSISFYVPVEIVDSVLEKHGGIKEIL